MSLELCRWLAKYGVISLESEHKLLCITGDLIEVLHDQGLIGRGHLIKKRNILGFVHIESHLVALDQLIQPDKVWFFNELELESAYLWEGDIEVLVEVLFECVVDINLSLEVYLFVFEYFGEVLSPDLDSEVVFLECEGHCL